MTATTHQRVEHHRDHPQWTDGVTAPPRGDSWSDLAHPPDRGLGVPCGLDVTTPMLSRIHNHLLGGAHTFGVDRAAAAELTAAVPAARAAVWAARAFLHRAIADLATRGVAQFLDIGCGIPTLGATHEILARNLPRARVVYVDRDPVAVLTARTMLATNSAVAVLHANLREPQSILDQIRGTALLDLSRPVALVLGAVLACLTDTHAYPAVTHLRDAVAPGSYLIITHPTPRLLSQTPPGALRAAAAVLRRTPIPLRPRPHADIARFFDGWTLTTPGLLDAADWRPDPDEPTHTVVAYPAGAVLAGVAYKPGGPAPPPASPITVH